MWPSTSCTLPSFTFHTPSWLGQHALLDDRIDTYASSTTPIRPIPISVTSFANRLPTHLRIPPTSLTLPLSLDTARFAPAMPPPTFASAAAGNNSHTSSSRDAGSEWCVIAPTHPAEKFAFATPQTQTRPRRKADGPQEQANRSCAGPGEPTALLKPFVGHRGRRRRPARIRPRTSPPPSPSPHPAMSRPTETATPLTRCATRKSSSSISADHYETRTGGWRTGCQASTPADGSRIS